MSALQIEFYVYDRAADRQRCSSTDYDVSMSLLCTVHFCLTFVNFKIALDQSLSGNNSPQLCFFCFIYWCPVFWATFCSHSLRAIYGLCLKSWRRHNMCEFYSKAICNGYAQCTPSSPSTVLVQCIAMQCEQGFFCSSQRFGVVLVNTIITVLTKSCRRYL